MEEARASARYAVELESTKPLGGLVGMLLRFFFHVVTLGFISEYTACAVHVRDLHTTEVVWTQEWEHDLETAAVAYAQLREELEQITESEFRERHDISEGSSRQ